MNFFSRYYLYFIWCTITYIFNYIVTFLVYFDAITLLKLLLGNIKYLLTRWYGETSFINFQYLLMSKNVNSPVVNWLLYFLVKPCTIYWSAFYIKWYWLYNCNHCMRIITRQYALFWHFDLNWTLNTLHQQAELAINNMCTCVCVVVKHLILAVTVCFNEYYKELEHLKNLLWLRIQVDKNIIIWMYLFILLDVEIYVRKFVLFCMTTFSLIFTVFFVEIQVKLIG